MRRYEDIGQLLELLPLFGQSRGPAGPLSGPLPHARAGAAVRRDLHRACNWPISGRMSPAIGSGDESICRRPTAAVSATTRRCSPAASAAKPSAGCWPPRWIRPKAFCDAGCRWCRSMPAGLQLDVALFAHGGLAILEAIRRQNYDVWTARPQVSKRDKWWHIGPLLVAVAARNPAGRGCVMNLTPEQIEAATPHVAAYARAAGSNFPAGFCLLPRAQHRAMDALYAFMRHTDDLVDGAAAEGNPREALAGWRAALAAALRGDFSPGADRPGAVLLPALADTVERFGIPAENLVAVLDGVEMDLARPRYETFQALTTYCERVASAVGLACIHVWGFRGPAALEPARAAGIALQLTNILRDLREDAAAGRIYLPLEDLRQCGYSIEQLQGGVTGAAFRRLMELEIGRAEQFYDRGGIAALAGAARATDFRHDDGHVSRAAGQDRPPAGRSFSAPYPRWPGEKTANCRPLGAAAAAKGRTAMSDENAPHRPLRVAIVGGGLAGLAAAAAAVEQGCQVELFEQSAHLGGRAGSFLDARIGALGRCLPTRGPRLLHQPHRPVRPHGPGR